MSLHFCKSALSIRGEHFPCDWPTDEHGSHEGWAHTNQNAQAVWSSTPVTIGPDELEWVRASERANWASLADTLAQSVEERVVLDLCAKAAALSTVEVDGHLYLGMVWWQDVMDLFDGSSPCTETN